MSLVRPRNNGNGLDVASPAALQSRLQGVRYLPVAPQGVYGPSEAS